MPHYTYIWEFYILPGSHEQFESEYGPDGAWVKLFRSAPGYVDTKLLKDARNSLRYVTIDTWESEEEYAEFRATFASQYEAIDQRCAGLTTRERLIGEFTSGY